MFLKIQLKLKVLICSEIKNKFKTLSRFCIEIADAKYQNTSFITAIDIDSKN